MISKEHAQKIVMTKLQEKLFRPFDTAEFVCRDNESYVFLLRSSRPILTGIPIFYLVDQQGCVTSYTGFKYFHLMQKRASLKKTIKNFFSPYRNLLSTSLSFFKRKKQPYK